MALKDLIFSIVAADKTGAAFKSVGQKLRYVEGAVASLDEKMARAGRGMRSFAEAGALPAAAAGLVLRDLVKAGADFEAAMNRVGAALGTTPDEFDALSDAAQAAGSSTAFSAIAAAEAIEVLAKNGLSASQVLGGGLSASLLLAASGGVDLAKAGDLATDVMLNFGKGAADLKDVANGVTGAMLASKFGFEDYAGALAQAGGVAGGLGATFEDFNAVLAATSGAFGSGSDAGTSFKTFMQRLVPQSKTAATAMQDLGLEFFTATGQMKPMAAIAQELQDALAGLSDQAKADALTDIFGSDAIRTAIGLAAAGSAGIRDLHAAIGEASAVDQATAKMSGFNGMLRQLGSAWDSLGVALEQSGTVGTFTSLGDKIVGLVRWLADLNPGVLKFTAVITAVGVALVPVIAAAGLLVAGIAALGAPVAGAIAVIGGLTAALVAFWPEIKAGAAWVGEMVTAIGEWLGDKLAAIVRGAIDLVGDVKDAFFDLWDAVVGNSYVPDMVDGIASEFGRLPTAMVKPAETATSAVDGLFAGLGEGVVGRVKDMRSEGLSAWDGFAQSMLDRANRMVDGIVDQAFDRLVTEAKSAFGQADAAAGGGGGVIGGGLGGFLSSTFSGLGSLLGFHDGGDFTVGGWQGIDRNVVAFRAEPGERVTVTPADQPAAGGRGPVTVNVYAQDVESFRRSSGQVASAISRAVGRADRYA